MMVARFSLRQRIALTLGIAVVLGGIPSTLQLFYLPSLYERSEEGADVERQWLYAEKTIIALTPCLLVDCFGAPLSAWGSHGYMRSWQYRWPWITMYLVNGLSWWCIILVVWFGIGKLRNLR